MAQLPPKAVFGAAHPGQAVHVLLLIENSLAMLDHWADLQQHILPGILGAVRVANPGIDVQVFSITTGITTGKTESTRDPEQFPQKSQRQFNDFPDIDIVNIPRNRMSATFIRQSIDMFLGGPTSAPHLPVTRHLFLVAMSSPVDDIGSPQSPMLSISTGSGASVATGRAPESTDAIWDTVCQKLQENDICLHVIANPAVRLTRIFDVFRKTMRAQSRQEVIPWQPVDNTHCICHLSGSNRYRREKREYPIEDWPEMNLPVSAPPSPRPGSPTDGSEDDHQHAYMSPMELINDNLSRAAAAAEAAASHNGPNPPYGPPHPSISGVGAGMSLVSRMQAIHGLANRRRPGERTRSRRAAFFRDSAPAGPGPPSPSPRRERLRSLGSVSMSMAGGPSSASGTGSSLSLFTGVGVNAGSPYPSPLTSTDQPQNFRERQELGATRTGRSRHHSLSSTSALDLQGLASSGATFASFHQLNSTGNVPYPIDTSSSLLSVGVGGGGPGILPPSSPASDTSGSASALSNSFVGLSPHHTQAQPHHQAQQHQQHTTTTPSLTPTQASHPTPIANTNLYASAQSYALNTNVSPLHAHSHFPANTNPGVPFSHIGSHPALHQGGYHTSPTLTQAFHTPLHSPTHNVHAQSQSQSQNQMLAEGGGGGGGGGFALSVYGPAPAPPSQEASCYFGPIGPSTGVAPRLGSEFALGTDTRRGFAPNINMNMNMGIHADGYGVRASAEGRGGEREEEVEGGGGEEEDEGDERCLALDLEDEEVVPASAPPSARDQRPFVFDASYEARSALKLRQAVGEMAVQQGLSSPPLPLSLSSHPHPHPQSQYHQQLQSSPPLLPFGVSGTGSGGYVMHSAPPTAPSLEATRSTSSTFSDSSVSASLSGLGTGRGLGLALDESWKGHSNPNPSTTATQNEIPELPETFYEPSRAGHGARLAERGAGVRRSTYGPS